MCLDGHVRGVTSLILLKNALWSSSRDTTIRVWDLVGLNTWYTEDKLSTRVVKSSFFLFIFMYL